VATGIGTGKIFRRINKTGVVSDEGLTAKTIWHVVKTAAKRIGVKTLAPHDLRRYAECLIMPNVVKRAASSKVRTDIHSA